MHTEAFVEQLWGFVKKRIGLTFFWSHRSLNCTDSPSAVKILIPWRASISIITSPDARAMPALLIDLVWISFDETFRNAGLEKSELESGWGQGKERCATAREMFVGIWGLAREYRLACGAASKVLEVDLTSNPSMSVDYSPIALASQCKSSFHFTGKNKYRKCLVQWIKQPADVQVPAKKTVPNNLQKSTNHLQTISKIIKYCTMSEIRIYNVLKFSASNSAVATTNNAELSCK